MAIADLLSRLSKVKPTGKRRWQALCPAHEDRLPSLTVTEADDGRILIHCFADCSADEIVGAVGLELSDLFPEKSIEHGKRLRRPWNPIEVLRATAREALVTSVAASRMGQGKELSADDRQRLMVAAGRLMKAFELATDDR